MLVGLVIGLCVAFALVGLSVQWIPFAAMQPVAAAAIPAGYADRFTPALHETLMGLLRGLAGFCLGVAAVLFVLRHRVAGLLDSMRAAVARELSAALAQASVLVGERPHTVALLGIVIGSAVLRGLFLGGLPHNDEAYSFTQYASRPPFIGLMYYTANNHILNTLLVHLSTSIFGPELWAMRLPAFLAGITIVPALYAAVRLHGNRDSAVLAAALAGVSMPLIEYSANARGYSPGTLFLLMMVIASAGAGPVARVSAGLAGAFAVFSVPTMLYGVAAVLVWRWLARRDWRFALVAGGVSGGVAGILYAPALAFSGLRALTSNRWTAPLTWPEWTGSLWSETLPALQPWSYWAAGLPWVCAALLAAAAFIGMFRRHSLYTVALGVTVAMIALQRVSPPMRIWLFLVPLMIWCASDVLAGLLRRARLNRYVPYLAVALWIVAAPFVATSEATAQTRGDMLIYAGAEQAARALAERYPRGSRVVCCTPWDTMVKFELARAGYREGAAGPELVIAGPDGAVPLGDLKVDLRPEPFCCSARLFTVERALIAQAEKMASTGIGGWPGKKRSTGTESPAP